MGVFCPIGGCQFRFRLDHPLVSADNPTSDKEFVTGGNVPAKSNPEFGRERFRPSSRYGLGHGFIENRTDDSAMHDSAEALPDRGRNPGRGYFAAGVTLKLYPQSVQIILPANKTARL